MAWPKVAGKINFFVKHTHTLMQLDQRRTSSFLFAQQVPAERPLAFEAIPMGCMGSTISCEDLLIFKIEDVSEKIKDEHIDRLSGIWSC